MKSVATAACAVVAVIGLSAPLAAQVGNPASPRVGTPTTSLPVGPPAPVQSVIPAPRSGPLPSTLTLAQSLVEAAARSPAVVAAEAEVTAAEARIRQSGYRSNPELSLEVENVAGTGELRGIRSMETTLAVNQRLNLGGRRSARIETARAALAVQQIRLAIARADLGQSVREQFARAVSAREKLAQANETVERARELARVTGILVEAGRDPPLRALRANTALAQAEAEREAAEAGELAARSSLAASFGVSTPVGSVSGSTLDLIPRQVIPGASLDVRLADAERLAAQAAVREQLAERKLDPAVGVGVRHVRATGDVGLVAGVSAHVNAANIQPLKMCSAYLRGHVSYPDLTAEEQAEIIKVAEGLLETLREHQLEENDFIRQALIEGIEAFVFRIERLQWLGWGYSLESLKSVVLAYVALDTGIADQNVTPIAAAMQRKLKAGLKSIFRSVGLAKDVVDRADFALKAYGAFMMAVQAQGGIAGLIK